MPSFCLLLMKSLTLILGLHGIKRKTAQGILYRSQLIAVELQHNLGLGLGLGIENLLVLVLVLV